MASFYSTWLVYNLVNGLIPSTKNILISIFNACLYCQSVILGHEEVFFKRSSPYHSSMIILVLNLDKVFHNLMWCLMNSLQAFCLMAILSIRFGKICLFHKLEIHWIPSGGLVCFVRPDGDPMYAFGMTCLLCQIAIRFTHFVMTCLVCQMAILWIHFGISRLSCFFITHL